MLKFVSLERETPEKRDAKVRRVDFDEIYRSFASDQAALQASRCSQCGVPFCQNHCPLGNDIPDWLRMVAEGRMREAWEISTATNNMPEICGRICPQDRLCEGSCVIEQSGHGTVTIGAIESYITETAFENGWVKPVQPRHELGESVGIVGSGPAGLSAAEELRRQGFQVTIYERNDRAGGLLIYGIPNFKLDKEIVERRIGLLKEAGIEFHLNCEIGRDVSLDQLRARHNAVLLATGVYAARDLECPVDNEANVVKALDYLTASNRSGLGDALDKDGLNELSARGKKIVVIGGGDTAMDCVRTAIRQGAESVRCLYRRDRANMPGSQREVGHAEEEGVHFDWLSAPKMVSKHVVATKMRLGTPDKTGRRQVAEIAESDFVVEADLVIKALGFGPEDLVKMMGTDQLVLNRWGLPRVHPTTLATSLDGVFAAGDIMRGASLVVWAIVDGRNAAAEIAKYLKQSAQRTDTLVAAE